MADRGILFSAPMVRALIAGTKTQTRRTVKKAAALDALAVFGPKFLTMPGNADLIGHAVGDRLYVRETWQSNGLNWNLPIRDMRRGGGPVHYRATDEGQWKAYWGGWKPGIHMPRWASRITLTVTEVRVQRLQDCSEADARAEGVVQTGQVHKDGGRHFIVEGVDGIDCLTARKAYRALWDKINGKGAWDSNPWVAAYTFTVRLGNIDQEQANA